MLRRPYINNFLAFLNTPLHHRRRQLPRVRVLPAWVITPDQPVRSARTITHRHDRTVRELRTRRYAYSAAPQQLQPRIERDLAERDDDTRARQRGDFRFEVIEAANDLLRHRLVVGRSAPHRGDDVRVGQREPVIDVTRRRDVGKAGTMQRRHEEVAGAADAVAGEDAPRAIGAVRRGRQPDEQHPRIRIAKAGHRPAPIGLCPVGALLLMCDRPAVRAQARTAFT